jgi:hypothetical protein
VCVSRAGHVPRRNLPGEMRPEPIDGAVG